jgi:threonine synthase
MIQYISTRGGGEPQSFEQVLLSGLAPDGGLYVPTKWPQIDVAALKGRSYQDIAEAVMFPFVEGSINRDDFRAMIDKTYGVFRHKDVVPLHKINGNLYALELFHGPTIAFKDVALQFLGRLFEHILAKRGDNVTIVGATSGDTGSAAIEGCRHSRHVQIFILHPHGRVSDVQRKQMTTVDAPNVHNIALEGNFDDCQNLVKAMFNDPTFRNELNLSAVNSINWARIMAQIVYYFTASLSLDEPASFVVPTGNFGNVFAAYCAQQMGLPMKTLAISTNRNDILTRFFESGTMKKEGVEPTVSPSMDIGISSNFERYLFDLLGRDAAALRSVMENFTQSGEFKIDAGLMQKARTQFTAFRANDEETLAVIKDIYAAHDYMLDPHTAVGVKAALSLAAQQDNPVVSLACAHPAKFPDAVMKATHVYPELPAHLADLFERKERLSVLPNDLVKVQQFIKDHVK